MSVALGARRARALALAAIAAGCAPAALPGADGGLDGAAAPLDAPADAPDTRSPRDAPIETFSLAEARAAYCEPLAAATCASLAACPCAIGAGPCEPDALVAGCTAELEAGMATDRAIDGRLLRALVSTAAARASACLPPDPRPLPPAVFLLPTILGRRCPAGTAAGTGCAGGLGLCAGGVCAPRARGACQPGTCEVGLRCVGTCVPPGGEGDACEPPTDLEREPCAPDLACVGGRCTRLAAPGGACSMDAECAPCSTCDDGFCVAVSRCAPDAPSTCGHGTACTRGTCRPLARLGERCDEVSCETGLVCLVPELVCATAPPVGEPCAVVLDPGTQCGLRGACVGGTCAPLPELGEPCALRCAGSLACVSGRCALFAEVGETCGTAAAPGPPCRDGFCGPAAVCLPFREVGEPCPSPDACRTSLCERGLCRAVAVLGEPCVAGRCGPGLACRADGVCDIGAGAACDTASSTRLTCGPGLRCVPAAACGW